MRCLGPTAAILSIVTTPACAAGGFDSLEPRLPEDEVEAFRFLQGSPWHADYIYAFQLTAERIFVVDSSDDPEREFELTLADCPSLAGQHARLRAAVADTARVAAGETPVETPDVIVMDGPVWRLVYSSRIAAMGIEFRGGGNSELVTPWIGVALDVRRIADRCAGKP